MQPNPLLKKLGYKDSDRVAVVHVDDVGMCQSGVEAFAELYEFGIVSSGAIMTPCPWALEAIKYAKDNPQTDLGVHITLTSEWDTYRWGPISTRNQFSGMLDEEGFFPRTAEEMQENGKKSAVRKEMKAQIQWAIDNGLNPTHADTHMGTVAHPKYMWDYLKIAQKFGLPPMMFRMDRAGWEEVMGTLASSAVGKGIVSMIINKSKSLEEKNIPLLDSIYLLPLDLDPKNRIQDAKKGFENLSSGITHYIIHAAKDGKEIRTITPNDCEARIGDYEAFMSNELKEFIEEQNIHIIGYQVLKDLMNQGSL